MFDKIKDKLILKISGKNIYNFIYRLNKLNIDLLKIDYINLKEVKIEIYKKDYDKVLENKTIYEVEIEDYDGAIRLRKILTGYKFVLIFIFLSLFIIYFLSNLIFKIEIVTNDKNLKEKLREELSSKGVSLYHLKKDYQTLQIIKSEILEKYKNEIDWIEIEVLGSKYIVRFEPRITTNINKDTKYQSIVAKKNALIYSMDVSSGQIIKNRYDYVKKGDTIVSGYIYLNEEIKNTVKATGKVYGEVWYRVTVKEKLKQVIKNKTGNSKNVFVFNFLNKDYQLFNFDKYKSYKKKNNFTLKNNLLPISFNLQKQEELDVKKENKTYEEALENAIKDAKIKLLKGFNESEFIKDYKILNEKREKDFLEVEIFFSVVEDISEYVEIKEYNPIEEKSE